MPHFMKVFKFIISIIFLFVLCSCQIHTPSPQDEIHKPKVRNLRTETIDAVDELLNNCINSLDKTKPIIVTSIVSVDDLHSSSTFGRMSAEIIANRFSQLGYPVKELKMNQHQIYIKRNQGEFILSRDIQDIAMKHDVQAIVVGTYAVSKAGYRDIHVCLKIIDPVSNVIGCSKCFISKTDEIDWE
ncbi:FlgO family outer membrane protein [Desulfobacter latus]|uniref:FlgO domain-containing protein n=1 Tax=Desulfobacter latus TaxID=2292 RepID=A0A850SZU3_9BACT|nr:FlgO family outer membrane protein [Desulfobacter latus]NWH05630.1 hypothetical protein [Desulfobacter latus]